MSLHNIAVRILILLCLMLAGCGKTRYVTVPSPDPAGGVPPPPVPAAPPVVPPVDAPDSVDESLELLGVSTVKSARLSDDGVALPDDFSPFGQRVKLAMNAEGETHIGAPMELMVGGLSLARSQDPLTVLDNLAMPARGDTIIPSVIHGLDNAHAPWAMETRGFEEDPPVTLRDGTGGDLDGDGYDELIVAYLESGGVAVRVDNLADGSVSSEILAVPLPAEVLPVGDIRIRAADLDRNGRTELILGVSQAGASGRTTRSALLVLERNAGILIVRHSRSFESTLATTGAVHVTAVLEPGNVDYDTATEIVLVLNEFVGTSPVPRQAATRFFILDDAAHRYAERLADTLSVVASSGTYHAQVADVTIGDIDDDLIGEIIFGGLADLTVAQSCNTDGNGGRGSLRYLLVMYEFTGSGFNKSRTAFSSDSDGNSLYPAYCQNQDAYSRALRFVDVNVLDFDDDHRPDLQANQFIFGGFPAHGANWVQRANFTLPPGVFLPDESARLVFDRNSAEIIVLDADGDGRDDLMTYRGGDDAIRIFSWRLNTASDEPELFQLARIPVQATIAGVSLNPLLVAFDADGRNEGDVQTLDFIEHQLEFTEPVVLAAVAAPPCAEGIGQVVDACTSAWGTAVVTGTEAEREITVKAGVTAGFEVEYQAGAGFVVDASTKVFGLSAKLTLSRELGFHRSESYEVTRSVSYETGPMEDSVVFSSIPYDFYTYEVIASTSVNTDDLGADRELHRIGMPRAPVIRMAEVEYYNSHTTASAVKIDEYVFDHIPGKLGTYPDRARRDEILAARRTQLDDIRITCPGCWQLDPDAPLVSGVNPFHSFDPVTALQGLMSEAVGVGQGSGSTEVAIDFARSSSYSRSLETSGELEVEFTAGIQVGGFALGGGLSHSTQISHGERTTYVGTVGSIDAAHFAQEGYRFGLFTYLQGDPVSGQEFEVINYWVE